MKNLTLDDVLSQSSQIKETKDYNLFYNSNSTVRHLSKENLERIKSEMEKYGEDKPFSPIFVVNDPDPTSKAIFRIVDGQQRFQIYKDLKLTIPYIVFEDSSKFTLDDVLSQSSEYTKIYETTNYELFGRIKANRELVQSNLNKIRESLKTKQIKEACVIVGFDPNPRDGRPLKIIEGQHRYKACMDLGLPVPYTIRKDFDIDDFSKSLCDVELLNTASETWDVSSFMVSKATLGEPNYVNYHKLKTDYPFEHEILFHMMKNHPERSKLSFQQFKDGELKLNDEHTEWMREKCEFLQEFLVKLKEERVGKRHYLKALFEMSMVESIDWKRLKQKLLHPEYSWPSSNSIMKSLDTIRDLYNKGINKRLIYIYDSGKGFKITVD
jgi:hypothetical protein